VRTEVGDIVVIELWPHWATCQRCEVDTLDRYSWPYYEDFVHTESTVDHGYVPVCKPCHDWLVENEHTLWKRPAPTVESAHE
jgi:hypothetical protein